MTESPQPNSEPSTEPDGLEAPTFRRGAAHSFATLVALLVLYYALPIGGRLEPAGTVALTLVGLLVGVVAITALAGSQIRRQIRWGRDANIRIQSLLALVYLAIVLFATTYFSLATGTEEQFAGLVTKTDALYFTLTTLATVGFGDVHAAGQAARAIVTFQIAFNLVVIGALISTITSRIRRGTHHS